MQKSRFGIYRFTHKACLLAFDIFATIAAFYLASKIRLGLIPNFLSIEFIGLTAIVISTLFLGNGYTSTEIGSRPKLPLNTFFIVLSSTIPATLFIYFRGPEDFTYLFGRGIFPFAITLVGALAVFNRYTLNFFFRASHRSRQILVVGDPDPRNSFNSEILQKRENINFIHIDRFTDIEQIQDLSAIVITPNYEPQSHEQLALVDCRLKGIPIFPLSDFYENFLFLVPVNEINSKWFFQAEGFTMLHSRASVKIKRIIDICLAIVLMVTTVPISILTAILIKIVSRGPIFFRQTRVGLQGRPFTLYKFRTMQVDSEKHGAQWAKSDDKRIIHCGKFLRTTRIDELPQCWNIIKGEMSIIGPRPERPEFTEQLAKEIPYYELRHIVKPGLSGWAQVSYPYGASVEDALRKLQYDLYYIKHYSLILDLNILLRTVLVTLGRKGR